MFCGGVGHFAAECHTRRNISNIVSTARTGRHTLTGASAFLTLDGSDSESGKEEAQE